MPGEGDYLFHNRGGGTFEDVSKKAGWTTHSTAMVWAPSGDYDNDGWPDLFVAKRCRPQLPLP